MISYDSGKALRAFATFVPLGLACCLISFETVLADEQSKPSTPGEADRQIASLLAKIEGALAQSETIPSETTQMLISAGGLLPSASPEGLRLLKGFPARLKKDADEAGDPRERKNTRGVCKCCRRLYRNLDFERVRPVAGLGARPLL